MKYKCVNHLDKFSFQDANMRKCELSENLMFWQADGIIARYNNPSNDTLVDRYIDLTEVRFKNPRVLKCLKEGQKYYNANDVLIDEIPDTPIPEAEYPFLWKKLKDGEMFIVNPKPAKTEGMLCCEVAVDVKNAEEDCTETYWFELEYEKVVLEWEHFQNRATVEG